MNIDAKIEAIEGIPRLGWVAEPTPVTEHPALAENLGLRSLRMKRDDLTSPLCGSSKTRKLDYLLAAEPWASADTWASVGAIGSGQLVSLVAAAHLLGRHVDAYLFWQFPGADVLQSLAYIASGPTTMHYRPSRLGLASSYPRVLIAKRIGGAAVIPPGGTSPLATLGTVRGGLELARQVLQGDRPAPDRVYVPLGSGGTAVGIAIGLGLGGVSTEVHAVSVVERPFVGGARLRRHRRQTLKLLQTAGLSGNAVPIVVRRGFDRPKYGWGSEESEAGTMRLVAEGVPGEPIYTGKAFACLSQDASRGETTTPLFWMTGRAPQLPAMQGYAADVDRRLWRQWLPEPLRLSLEGAARATRMAERLAAAKQGTACGHGRGIRSTRSKTD